MKQVKNLMVVSNRSIFQIYNIVDIQVKVIHSSPDFKIKNALVNIMIIEDKVYHRSVTFKKKRGNKMINKIC